MHRTIVIEFSTLDGIIEDPDGAGGTPNGAGTPMAGYPLHLDADVFVQDGGVLKPPVGDSLWLDVTGNLTVSSGAVASLAKFSCEKYFSASRSLTTTLPEPSVRRTRAVEVLRRPVPRNTLAAVVLMSEIRL